MSPEFAVAVDPVFMCVLDLRNRIQEGQRVDPEAEKIAIRNALQDAESVLGHRRAADWKLAKYALVAWIDELAMFDFEWNEDEWCLEVSYLGLSRNRGHDFFTAANKAAQLPHRDALEVFYLCFVLGFLGFYRQVDDKPETRARTKAQAESLEVPPTPAEWAARTAKALGARRPPFSVRRRESSSPAPLEGKLQVLNSSVVCLTLGLLAFIVIFFVVNSGSN